MVALLAPVQGLATLWELGVGRKGREKKGDCQQTHGRLKLYHLKAEIHPIYLLIPHAG